MGLGTTELIIIFLIALLIFGGKKIPEIAKGLGKGIREFKTAQQGESEKTEEVKKIEQKPEEKTQA